MWRLERRLVRALALSALVLLPRISAGQATTQRSSSILFFPLVVAGSAEDTLIQIANTSNSVVQAGCSYIVTTAGAIQATDFAIALTKQQPTQWVVSRGRPFADTDQRCSADTTDCSAGFDPGIDLMTGAGVAIPAAPVGFRGALVCVEADGSGFPVAGNHLIGQAMLVDSASQAHGYQAVGLFGTENLNADGQLCLGQMSQTANCPLGAEYAGCPTSLSLNHLADGAEDQIAGSGSSVTTDITAMTCNLDLVNGQSASVGLDFAVITDLEQTFSASTTVEGWLDANLSDISSMFGIGTLGSSVARTTITASPGGAAIIGNEVHAAGNASGAAGFNLQLGDETGEDEIVVRNPF